MIARGKVRKNVLGDNPIGFAALVTKTWCVFPEKETPVIGCKVFMVEAGEILNLEEFQGQDVSLYLRSR